VLQVVTAHIQQTWHELLSDQTCCEHQGDVEQLWALAHLRQVPQGLRAVSLERCLLLEQLLAGQRCVSASSRWGQ